MIRPRTDGSFASRQARAPSEPFGTGLLGDVAEGARWLMDPEGVADARETFLGAVLTAPGQAASPVLLALAGIALRRRLLGFESMLSARVGHVGRDAWWVTPAAIALVVLLALPLPSGIAAVGLPLLYAGVAGTLAQALGVALLAAATLLFALDLFRWLARPRGVFVTHFGWNEAAAADLHRHLRRFVRVQVPMSFTLAIALASARPKLRYGLGLLAFTASSLALGAFARRLFRPVDGVLALVASRPRPSVGGRLAGLLLVAVPVGIGLLPLAGWLDAAIALQTQVFRSTLLLLGAVVLYGLLMRLYAVSLRRYALRWAYEQRAGRARSRDAAAAGDALPGVAGNESLAPAPLAGQARVALMAVVATCVVVGLWWLWSPLLPALGVADEIVLWRRAGTGTDGSFSSDVTLWSLMLAAGLATAGILAARNLRGLLQVGLLRRLDPDPGTRYAMVTIAGYVAFGAGLVGALAQLGIDWSKLQWIVAALGVGLGFGLQEIVANFVSGLIILFERPVRVGDTVTIGTLSGTVSDIRIRATTVTDFENREVLLPNKSIITENVTNWTLHDSITRLLLRIGVAYGSDVEAVRVLLTEVVRSHPDVLAVPVSTVFFVGHGPSSLDFELRVFVASPSQRLPVTHDLNTAIGRVLDRTAFVIPFPQADIHLRVADPVASDLPLRIAKAQGAGSR